MPQDETPSTARAVHVCPASQVKDTPYGQTQGMNRQNAIVNVSPQICSLLMRAQPRSSSAIHHHGEQDTILYAISGTGAIASIGDDGKETREVLKPGDWALIPAFREHREVNDGDEELVWAIIRAPGGAPVTVNLTGWGGEEEQKQ